MPIVLDNSISMAWCFGEVDPYAAHVRRLLVDDDVLVPSIWPWEVANAILVGERRGRLDVAQSTRFLTLLHGLDITIDMTGGERILGSVLNLARAYNLSSYDAAYLELAAREGIALATTDQRLRVAAQQAGVILVDDPS